MTLPNPFPEGIRMATDRHGIDDFAARDVSGVRLERMDTGHYWLAIYTNDGGRLVIDLMSDRRIEAHWRVDPAFREAVLAALSPDPPDPPNFAPGGRSRGTGDPRKPESK